MGTLVLALLLTTGASAQEVSVPLPCKQSPGVITVGLEDCTKVKQEFTQSIENFVDLKYKGFKENVVADLSTSTSVSNPQGRSTSKKFCFPGNGFDNSTSKCGSYHRFTMTDGGNLKDVHRSGNREKSFYRGAYARAFKCYGEQVKKEVRDNQFRATLGNANKGKNIFSLYQNGHANSIAARAPEGRAELLEKLDAEVNANGEVTGIDQDSSLHVESLGTESHIAAAVPFTKPAVLKVIRAEIYARTERGYYEAFLTRRGKDKLTDYMTGRIESQCKSRVKSCKGTFDFDEGCGGRKLTSCYAEKYGRNFKNFVNARFPENGSCNPEASASWIVVLTFLASFLRRRRMYIAATLLVAISVSVTSCKGRVALPGEIMDHPGDVVNDMDNDIINGPPQETDTGDDVANLGNYLDNASESAEGDTEDAINRLEPGRLAQNAATAGEGMIEYEPGKEEDTNKLNTQLAKLGSNLGSDKTGSGGEGSGGSGGGLGGGFGNVGTSPADLSGSAGSGSGSEDGQGGFKPSAYAASAGGAGANGSGRSGSRRFASTGGKYGSGGAGAGSDSDDFGDSDSSGDLINPMGSEDPEDYFSFTSVNDSLFKIVEIRYKKETIAWARRDLDKQ